jgi:hypothetical protein
MKNRMGGNAQFMICICHERGNTMKSMSKFLSVMVAMLFAFSFLNVGIAPAAQSPQIPIAGKAIPHYAAAAASERPRAARWLRFSATSAQHPCEFDAKVLPPAPPCARRAATDTGGVYSETPGVPGRLSDYPQDTYIGPVIKYALNCGSSESADVHCLDQ